MPCNASHLILALETALLHPPSAARFLCPRTLDLLFVPPAHLTTPRVRLHSVPVRVALLQIAITDDESVDDRVTRVLAATDEVARDHDVVVLPELWPIGAFATDLVSQHAIDLSHELPIALGDIAARHSTWVFGGSIPELRPHTATGYSNTALVHDPDGALAGIYRKMHLFGFNGGETSVMTAGSEVLVLDTPLGRTGLATCYDLRFPELFRAMIDLGAEAFVMPSGWPERRLYHWQALARARAIENQAYFIGCNQSGTHSGVPMAGHSLVVDPQGEVLAEAGPDEQVLHVDIDPTRVAAWRAAFPALADRRSLLAEHRTTLPTEG